MIVCLSQSTWLIVSSWLPLLVVNYFSLYLSYFFLWPFLPFFSSFYLRVHVFEFVCLLQETFTLAQKSPYTCLLHLTLIVDKECHICKEFHFKTPVRREKLRTWLGNSWHGKRKKKTCLRTVSGYVYYDPILTKFPFLSESIMIDMVVQIKWISFLCFEGYKLYLKHCVLSWITTMRNINRIIMSICSCWQNVCVLKDR